ncbi:MAG: RNA-directed DNA polymerase [Planctomycetota bacterium]
MVTAVGLLTRGFFPRELPPAFTTEAFGKFVDKSRSSLPSPTKKIWTKCVVHNSSRPGSLRRALRLPNPERYIDLCDAIETHWGDLAAAFSMGSLSISRPLVRRTILDRAVVPRYSLSGASHIRARRAVGCRYFVRTDINQFYPSIYTHSIPWALHGKLHSKMPAHLGKTNGDKIDKAVRDLQDGQTIGVPIGPDTSLVIAESILGAVDSKLKGVTGFRFIDDYELGFGSLSAAEDGLMQLQSSLTEFQLNLNPLKTSIVEGPIALGDRWAIEISRFRFRTGKSSAMLNDAVAFFSRAFELAKEFPRKSVLKYGLKMSQHLVFDAGSWPTFEALLYNTLVFDPTAAPFVIVVLNKNKVAGMKISKISMAKALDAIILRHAPLGHGSEVAWAIFAAMQFKIELSSTAAKLIGIMDDDIVALLALDADTRGLFPTGSLDRFEWNGLVSLPNALTDEHWLLAYEANRKGWISCPAVASHPFFSVLYKAKISFYDGKKTLTSFVGPAASLPAGSFGGKYA